MSNVTEFQCPFCSKYFVSNRSRAQHQWKCKLNPDHKDIWNKGLTSETSEIVRRCSIAKSITSKNKSKVVSIYKPHNDMEILKWRDYVTSLNLDIPAYTTRENQGYKILVGNCHMHSQGTHYKFEQYYLMELVFNSSLPKGCIIHHVDENKLNNSLGNLIVFKSVGDHVRFHNSSSAYLIYDNISHMFTCINNHAPLSQQ